MYWFSEIKPKIDCNLTCRSLLFSSFLPFCCDIISLISNRPDFLSTFIDPEFKNDSLKYGFKFGAQTFLLVLESNI